MKKFYASLLALSVGGALFAQHAVTGLSPVAAPTKVQSASKVTAVDTITDYLDRATAYYILTAGSSGYVLGTNGFTTETAQHYSDLGGSTTVTELMVYFVHKEIMGTADNVSGKVYDVGADSLPTTLVAFGSVNAADIDTSGFPTFIMMTSSTGPVAAGGFAVSIEYTSDDTIALLSSNPLPSGGGPDGAGERRCLQNTTSIGWEQAADIWTIGGAAFDADAMILPIVDVGPVGVDASIDTKEFSLKGAFPNPAIDYTTIRYSLPEANTVSVVVFDVKGQVVARINNLEKAAGEHELVLNVSDFAAGKYYYQFNTANRSVTSKFVVVK
jgi:hypothetical protein